MVSNEKIESLIQTGRGIAYLKHEFRQGICAAPGNAFFKYPCCFNWSVTGLGVDIPVMKINASKHNIARYRIDVWFSIGQFVFHGVNIGDNDILRIKKLKKLPAHLNNWNLTMKKQADAFRRLLTMD